MTSSRKVAAGVFVLLVVSTAVALSRSAVGSRCSDLAALQGKAAVDVAWLSAKS